MKGGKSQMDFTLRCLCSGEGKIQGVLMECAGADFNRQFTHFGKLYT